MAMMKQEKVFVHGFTIIELLVAMLISSIVVGAIYTTYNKQQRIYTAQDQVVDVQQNLRAALSVMENEIKMAGYDPHETGLYGVTAASAGSFAFTADLNNDAGSPGTGESFKYELYDSSVPPDGVNDSLRRTPGGSSLADNIYNLEFYYQLSDGTWTTSPTTMQLNAIRVVKISILARSGRTDPDYVDTRKYITASGAQWGPFNDNYRRRFMITTVKCRNLGI
ncbi:PilW family protein [Desulfobacterota bacterium M19]